MGSWGVGGFENDVAGDWSDRLIEEDDPSLIAETLEHCVTRSTTADGDACQAAVAAAEVVAASGGRPSREFPDELTDWLRTSQFVAGDDLFQLAATTVSMIRSESELAELYEHDARWKRSISGLLRRLRSGAKPGRTGNKTRAQQMPEPVREVIQHLRRKGARPHIRKGIVEGLEFDYEKLMDEDLVLIARLPDLRGIFLDSQRHITDAGIVQLACCTKLETIDLSWTAVTDAALEKLADLPVLDDLRVRKTAISDAGLKHLHRLRALVKLDARASNVTPRALRELQQRFPDCEIDPPTRTNGNPPLPVRPSAIGWVQCPHCGWKFSLSDKDIWDGEKHLRCGQLLILTDASDSGG